MATDDIQLKLQQFLDSTELFTEEMQVVYLLVEVRKLIDKEPGKLKDEYRNIKFYCDWTLHTEKSRNFQGLDNMFEVIYQSCKHYFENMSSTANAKEVVDFLYFEKLKEHLSILFEHYNLPKHMLENREVWISFVKRLLEVLTDQPITNIPGEHLKKICIIGANDQSAAIGIYFTESITAQDGTIREHYQHGNAF